MLSQETTQSQMATQRPLEELPLWWFRDRTEYHGPITTEHLRQLLRTQRLNSQDLIWRPGWLNWQPIASELLFTGYTHQPAADQVSVYSQTYFEIGSAETSPQIADREVCPASPPRPSKPALKSSLRSAFYSGIGLVVAFGALISTNHLLTGAEGITDKPYPLWGAQARVLSRATHSRHTQLVVATNFPASAHLEIVILGLKGTLIDQISFEHRLQTTTRQQNQVIDLVRLAPSIERLPEGEYKISLACKSCSSSNGPHQAEVSYLRFSDSHASYQKRLKTKNKPRIMALNQELTELQQIYSALIEIVEDHSAALLSARSKNAQRESALVFANNIQALQHLFDPLENKANLQKLLLSNLYLKAKQNVDQAQKNQVNAGALVQFQSTLKKRLEFLQKLKRDGENMPLAALLALADGHKTQI